MPHAPPARKTPAGRCAAAVLLAALLAACGDGSGHTGPPPGVAGGDAGPIVVASGKDVSASGVRRRLVEAWNSEHQGQPGMQAKLVELPGTADEQRSQLAGALQSGSASYDVVNLDITWVPEFAQAHLIRPLGKAAADRPEDIIRKVRDTGSWNGETYAVPFNTDAGLLFYRADYLKQLELPLPGSKPTWQQLSDIFRALDQAKERGDSGLPKAYEAAWVGQYQEYEGLTVNTMEAFWSANGPHAQLSNASGHYTSTPAQLEKALRRTVQLASPPTGLQSSGTSDFDELTSLNAFAAGRTAFLRHWPYAYSELKAALPPKADLRVTQLPGPSALGGQNLAVVKDSPHAAAAERLVAYLTDPDSERCLLDAGFAATRTSSYRDDTQHCRKAPLAAATAPDGEADGEDPAPALTDQAGRPVYAEQLLTALKRARPRPQTPYYAAVTRTVQRAAHPILGQATTEYGKAAHALDRALENAFTGR